MRVGGANVRDELLPAAAASKGRDADAEYLADLSPEVIPIHLVFAHGLSGLCNCLGRQCPLT